jgi:hypothetical protein
MQCGSDIQLHRLIHEMREPQQMNNEAMLLEQSKSKKTIGILMILKATSSSAILIFAIVGIFIGVRFLLYLNHLESYRVTTSTQWVEIGFEQLQRMNQMMEKELNLIIELREENLNLRKQVSAMKSPEPAPINHSNVSELSANGNLSLPLGEKG